MRDDDGTTTVLTRDLALASYWYAKRLPYLGTTGAQDPRNAAFLFDDATGRARALADDFVKNQDLRSFVRARRFLATSLEVARRSPTRACTVEQVRSFFAESNLAVVRQRKARAAQMDRERRAREHQEQAEG